MSLLSFRPINPIFLVNFTLSVNNLFVICDHIRLFFYPFRFFIVPTSDFVSYLEVLIYFRLSKNKTSGTCETAGFVLKEIGFPKELMSISLLIPNNGFININGNTLTFVLPQSDITRIENFIMSGNFMNLAIVISQSFARNKSTLDKLIDGTKVSKVFEICNSLRVNTSVSSVVSPNGLTRFVPGPPTFEVFSKSILDTPSYCLCFIFFFVPTLNVNELSAFNSFNCLNFISTTISLVDFRSFLKRCLYWFFDGNVLSLISTKTIPKESSPKKEYSPKSDNKNNKETPKNDNNRKVLPKIPIPDGNLDKIEGLDINAFKNFRNLFLQLLDKNYVRVNPSYEGFDFGIMA